MYAPNSDCGIYTLVNLKLMSLYLYTILSASSFFIFSKLLRFKSYFLSVALCKISVQLEWRDFTVSHVTHNSYFNKIQT